MNSRLLVVLACLYGLITVYFLWRYFLRRRDPSIVCALMPLGWIAAFAIQIKRLSPDMTLGLFGLGAFVATWGIYIIVSHELSREKPFR